MPDTVTTTSPFRSSDAIVVTGGAGFIGANLVNHLLAATPVHVIVVDTLTYAANPRTVESWSGNRRVTFIAADIADRPAMESIVSRFRPAAIVNLAAETHVDRSIDTPDAFVRTNLTGTFVLLDVARSYLQPLEPDARRRFRFLQVSTDEVYGSLGPEGQFSETTPYAPSSPYSASKAGADHFVRAYFHTYGLPALVTNCSNNYGPFQHPEKLIPLMILNAAAGRRLPIYGNGRNVRDWLHVDDHCRGLTTVLCHAEPGAHYNIGASNEQPNTAIVEAICDVLEELRPASHNDLLRRAGVGRYADLKSFVPDRPGHDWRYAVDARRLRRELSWAPTWAFRDGLRQTVAWYLEHTEWCHSYRVGYDRERLGLCGVAASRGGNT